LSLRKPWWTRTKFEKQKADALLVQRLLRYLNSSAFLLSAEVRSVRHALMVVRACWGKQICKWLALVVTLPAGAGRIHRKLLAPP